MSHDRFDPYHYQSALDCRIDDATESGAARSNLFSWTCFDADRNGDGNELLGYLIDSTNVAVLAVGIPLCFLAVIRVLFGPVGREHLDAAPLHDCSYGFFRIASSCLALLFVSTCT